MSRRASRRGLPSTSGIVAPADRHYRRPDIRPGRRRRIGQRIAQVGRVGGVVLVVSAAAFWAGTTILQSGLLNVNRIVVRGNTRLSNGDVEALLADMRGRPILDVDFTEYQQRLLDSPWVASVTLWRLLPATVEVRVTERQPMAIARLGDQLYLVDHAGVVIDTFGPHYSDLDLPIVDGLLRRPSGDAPIVDPERVKLTGRVLAAFESRPSLLRQLSQVDVSDVHDVVVLVGTDPALLHLGDEQFAERLSRYLDLKPTIDQTFDEIDYVDLRFERLFVRAAGRTDVQPFGRRP